ncbi:MAG: penicillin-binding transpeptidase domain-containing protein [Christensenellales bacterium]|jgi:peptidoglycan glycosyltransferase
MKLIKQNIRRIAAILSVLMLSMIVYGAYSITVFGNRWFSSNANNYARKIKAGVVAGSIFDRNQQLLADTSTDGKRVYHQQAAVRSAVVHAVGDSAGNIAYGAETFMANHLYGFNGSYIQRVMKAIRHEKRRGNDITLTIDSMLSADIARLFPAGKSGAVIVMNYQTGEVLVMQSYPLFDPMRVTREVEMNPLKPFWNRATRWLSAPGSTYKVLTLASLLTNDANAQNETYFCAGSLDLTDTSIVDAGGAAHGHIGLKQAFAVSCNIAFAQIALNLGDEAMRKTAEAFKLNDYFLFKDIVVENSVYPSINRSEKEIAWTGVGQSALAVTPLHMCMVAAAIANDGVMMEPGLLLKAASPVGETVAWYTPKVYASPVNKHTADLIADMMAEAVQRGTARGAAVRGARVCGKTGSAQVDRQADTNAWFIGFLDNPATPYAVCVVVENAGGGGAVAAPLAGKIFSKLSGRH